MRADKILKLRTLLDQLSEVQGLVSEEKGRERIIIFLYKTATHRLT